jgi:2-dehydropantoate 2-reductase
VPTIAIVGAGAVGAYYGSRLWESGAYDVKFQMRGEHYEKSRELGLNVTSVHGDIFIPPESLQVYTDTKEIGPVDWVIVALKSSALDAIPELIYPLLIPGKTRVLTIMNGLIEEDLISNLRELAGEDQEDSSLKCCAALYGGMALVCCNRLGPGRIDHSYAGLLSGGVAACATTTTKEENKEAFEKLWEPTKVEIAYEPSLLAGRWRKVCAPGYSAYF